MIFTYYFLLIRLEKIFYQTVNLIKQTLKRLEIFLNDKKALIVYWDKDHKIFDFNTLEYVSNFHITNKNIPDEGLSEGQINHHDQIGSHHHMSARGNLLLGLELSKLLIA